MIYNTQTKLYGVIGYPVKHSSSPALFNQIFRAHDYNGVYLAFEDSDLNKLIVGMKNLNVQGFSVTLPFKEEALEYLDEIDPLAEKLGCINTIKNVQGRLVGYNFDGHGAMLGLEEFFQKKSISLKGDKKEISHSNDWENKNFLIIGSGGAARGILLTLASRKTFQGKITLAARNEKKAQSLLEAAVQIKKDLVIDYQPFNWLKEKTSKKDFSNIDILIQTTPMGMFQKSNLQKTVGESPVLGDNIHPEMVVYDIVYNPLETPLLKQAKSKGAAIITGLNMFLGQASLQLKTWTSVSLDLTQMHHHFKQSHSNPN